MSVDIIILTIAILIILFEKIPLLFNKKSSSKEKRISVILIILLISSLGLVAYKEFKSDQYSKSSGVIDDDLKPKISNIIINVGPGIDIISGDLKEFKREDSGAPLFDGLDIWIEDDKLKISSTIPDESEQIIAKLEANEWQVNPNKIFDRNFDNKGIEVIDDKGDVILQADIKGYDKLDFSIPARLIRTFVWDLFASHYLEMVKPRAYNSMGEFVESEQNAAWYTLHIILKVVLKLLSIISPFITEKLYRELYDKGQSIHLTGFPKPLENIDDNYTQNTSLLLDTNRVLWKIKTDNDLSLRDTLVEVWLPESLKPFINDLQTMHSIKNINLGIPSETKSYEIFEVQGAKLYIQVK